MPGAPLQNKGFPSTPPKDRDLRVTFAEDLLARIVAGDETSVDVAVGLAELVLAEARVSLALDVLDGGGVMPARAIGLAEAILTDPSGVENGGGR